MAILNLFEPSNTVSLTLNAKKDGKISPLHSFKKLTFTRLTDSQLKEISGGNQDLWDLWNKNIKLSNREDLLGIKLKSIEDTEENRHTRGSLADKILSIQDDIKINVSKMNNLKTGEEVDIMKEVYKIQEGKFKIAIGGDDVADLIDLIESKKFHQLTYDSAFGILEKEAGKKKGN